MDASFADLEAGSDEKQTIAHELRWHDLNVQVPLKRSVKGDTKHIIIHVSGVAKSGMHLTWDESKSLFDTQAQTGELFALMGPRYGFVGVKFMH